MLRILGVLNRCADLRRCQHVSALQHGQQATIHRHHLQRGHHPHRLHRLRQLHLQLAGQPLQVQDVIRADDVWGQPILLPLHCGFAARAGRLLWLVILHDAPLWVCLSRRAAVRVLGMRSALHLLHHQPVWRCHLHHHHDAAAGHRYSPLLLPLRSRSHHGGWLWHRSSFPGTFLAGVRT